MTRIPKRDHNLENLPYWVWELGFYQSGLGLKAQGLGLRACSLRLSASGLEVGLEAWGLVRASFKGLIPA